MRAAAGLILIWIRLAHFRKHKLSQTENRVQASSLEHIQQADSEDRQSIVARAHDNDTVTGPCNFEQPLAASLA